MLARLDRSEQPLTEALLHQYRIISKRSRYAAEFAAPSPEADQFIAALKRLQDASGDWHDWLILTQAAKAQLGEVRESSLVAELHNVTGAKFRNAIAVLSQMRTAQAASKSSAPATKATATVSHKDAQATAAA
jgi:CHAD domain-containing protein